MTADPDNLHPTYSNSPVHIPDVPFDSIVPLSIANLRRAVDVIKPSDSVLLTY